MDTNLNASPLPPPSKTYMIKLDQKIHDTEKKINKLNIKIQSLTGDAGKTGLFRKIAIKREVHTLGQQKNNMNRLLAELIHDKKLIENSLRQQERMVRQLKLLSQTTLGDSQEGPASVKDVQEILGSWITFSKESPLLGRNIMGDQSLYYCTGNALFIVNRLPDEETFQLVTLDGERVTSELFAQEALKIKLESELETRKNVQPDVKFVNKIMRQVIGDRYPAYQLLHKHFILKKLTSHPDWKQDKQLRQLIKDVLVTLQNSHDKDNLGAALKHDFRTEFLQMEEDIRQIDRQIEQVEAGIRPSDIATPSDITSSGEFASCLHVHHSKIERAEPSKVGAVPSSAMIPSSPLDLSERASVAGSIISRLEVMQTLKKNGQYEELDRAAAQIMAAFDTPEAITQFVKGIPREQTTQWIDRFYQITEALAISHLALGRNGMPPSRVLAMLKGFIVLQELLRSDPRAKFNDHPTGSTTGFTFSNQFLHVALKDPYFDQGTSGPDINKFMAYWDQLGDPKKRIESSPAPYQQAYHYLRQFGDDPQQVLDNPPAALQGFAQVHQASFLLHFMLSPGYTVTSTLDLNVTATFTRKRYLNDQKEVREKLAKFSGTITFTPSKDKKYMEVHPLGLRFYNPLNACYLNGLYSNKTSGAITNYKEQRVPVCSREIRKRMVEGVVARTGAGASEYGDITNYRMFRFQGAIATPQMIQDELPVTGAIFPNCSVDLSKKLQLMQTAPLDRVRNTILTFSQHTELLKNSDWQRVCELNCFRDAALYKQLQQNPDYAAELVGHLRILCIKFDQGEVPGEFLIPFLARVASVMHQLGNEQWKDVNGMIEPMLQAQDQWLLGIERSLVERGGGVLPQDYERTCRAYLFALSQMPSLSIQNFTEQRLEGIFKRYIGLAALPRKQTDEDMRVSIADFIDGCLPRMVSHLRGRASQLGVVTSMRVSSSSPWQPSADGVIWSTESHAVNLQTGQIYSKKRNCERLPLHVSAALSTLLPPAAKRQEFQQSYFKIQGKVYARVELVNRFNQQMRVYFTENPADPPIVFMQRDGNWYQRQTAPFVDHSDTPLPRELRKLTCWSDPNSKKIIFLDDEGRIRFRAQVQLPDTLINLEKVISDQMTVPMRSMPKEQRAVFCRLEAPSGIVLETDRNQNVRAVDYPELGLTYTWDNQQGLWVSQTYPGYHLVSAPIHDYLKVLAKDMEESPVVSYFPRGFTDYHILESQNEAPSKLVMSGREYADVALSKHSHRRLPKERIDASLYTFEIDPHRGLRAERPEAYLYLSYVLYTQGKYQQSQLAMRQAFTRLERLSEEVNDLIDYFSRWPTQDPNAIALRTQLSMYQLEQSQLGDLPPEQAVIREQALKSHLDGYLAYLKIEDTVDPQLRLSKEDKERMQFYAPRSHAWVSAQLHERVPNLDHWKRLFSEGQIKVALKSDDVSRITGAIAQTIPQITTIQQSSPSLSEDDRAFLAFLANLNVEQGCQDLKIAINGMFLNFSDIGYYIDAQLIGKNGQEAFFENTIEKAEKESQLLRWALDREIQMRTKRLPPVTQPLAEEAVLAEGAPVFSLNLDQLLTRRAVPQTEMESYAQELEAAFEKGTFQDEMAREIAQDFREYSELMVDKSPYQGIKEDADLQALDHHMQERERTLRTQVDKCRQEIANLFTLGAPAHSLLRHLKGQHPVVIDLFQQGRLCFGEQDFTPLLEREIIDASQIATLNALYRQYCLANVELQQVEKVRKQQRKCQRELSAGDRTIETGKLTNLLQQKRHYAMDNNPYAFALLLIEDEMGIVCDENQVKHFMDMIRNKSSFKHEAWGGGKTTVLRHLITKFHANGQNLSSLLTHAPLKKEHHRNLVESTAAVYGQQAFDTDFSRTSPTDGIALRRQYLTLLKAVEERGRTDQTMNSLLSLRHAYNLKLIGLDPKHPNDALNDELTVFSQILQFRQQRMVVGSDELDQLFTPDREHNYAIGAPVQLDKQFYQPAFEILKALADCPESTFFTMEGRNPKDIPQDERRKLLGRLADAMIEKYQFADIDSTLLKRYWLTPANEFSPEEYQTILQFFNDKVISHPNADLLQMLHLYFNSIIPLSFDNSCGVTFGRSKDGVHTKPCANSGDPAEKSQHGSLPLLVWYSCLDYWKEGVNEKTAHAYVTSLKEKAQKERMGPVPMPLDDTAVGQKFVEKFRVKLSEVSEADYPTIAQIINSNLDLKIDCLHVANFENMKVHSRRLEGNGKLAAHDVREIWGCSGNNERVRTLPDKVKLHPELIRQKGTIGRIFYNLISDKSQPVIEYNATTDGSPVTFLAEKLKPGMALVDVGPFLQGMKPEKCADRLMALMPNKIPIRYINSEGRITVRLVDGRDVPYDTSGVVLSECVTLYTHKDRRGQDLPLPPEKTNLMTVSGDTSLTDFSQGGMRDRQWGKGKHYQYIQDASFAQAIAARPRLRNLSKPSQMMALFIENETQRIQRLDTVANKQEVRAVGDAAVQQMLRSTNDPRSLTALTQIIKQKEHSYLDQNAECNPQELSRPLPAMTGYEAMQLLIQKERKQLKALMNRIEADQSINEHFKADYLRIIQGAIENLNDKMIMEARYLVPFTTAADEHGMVEEVEAEAEREQEVQAAVELKPNKPEEHEQQMETEVSIEQEARVEIETEEEREEPRVDSPFSMNVQRLERPEDLISPQQALIRVTPNIPSYRTQGVVIADYTLWIDGECLPIVNY